MKTTLEIDDELFREAKVFAAENGKTLKQLVSEFLAAGLKREKDKPKTDREKMLEEKPWMKSFGGLKHLHEENVRIQKIIDEEFGKIEPEDWE